jgi:hypothetical protein
MRGAGTGAYLFGNNCDKQPFNTQDEDENEDENERD